MTDSGLVPQAKWPRRVAVTALFCVPGLYFLGVGILEVRSARESASWPSVQGRVVSAKVTRQVSSGTKSSGADRTGSRSGSRSSVSFHAKVVYEYTVGGMGYSNDKIAFQAGGDREEAERLVAKYPAKGPVTVYYRPGDPQKSVLEPGTKPRTPLGIYLGIVFIVVTIAVSVALSRFKTSE